VPDAASDRLFRLVKEQKARVMGSEEPPATSSELRRLERRVRDLERLLGRKNMEIEILREALAEWRSEGPRPPVLLEKKAKSLR
jgi:transposase